MDVEKFLVESINEIRRDLTELKTEVAVLKTKAAIWGSLAGSVPVVIGFIIKHFI